MNIQQITEQCQREPVSHSLSQRATLQNVGRGRMFVYTLALGLLSSDPTTVYTLFNLHAFARAHAWPSLSLDVYSWWPARGNAKGAYRAMLGTSYTTYEKALDVLRFQRLFTYHQQLLY